MALSQILEPIDVATLLSSVSRHIYHCQPLLLYILVLQHHYPGPNKGPMGIRTGNHSSFSRMRSKKGPETCNSHSTGDTDVFCSHSLMLIHFLRERLYIIRIYSCHEAMIMEKTRFLLRFISACQSYITGPLTTSQ